MGEKRGWVGVRGGVGWGVQHVHFTFQHSFPSGALGSSKKSALTAETVACDRVDIEAGSTAHMSPRSNYVTVSAAEFPSDTLT